VDLRLLDGGRAVLIGHDHEYSETCYGAGADYFGVPRTDLFAGAPAWWAAGIADYLAQADAVTIWIGFVYGFDGECWSRARYTSPDGFESIALPTLSDEAATDFMAAQVDAYAKDRSLATQADRTVSANALLSRSIPPPHSCSATVRTLRSRYQRRTLSFPVEISPTVGGGRKFKERNMTASLGRRFSLRRTLTIIALVTVVCSGCSLFGNNSAKYFDDPEVVKLLKAAERGRLDEVRPSSMRGWTSKRGETATTGGDPD